MNERKKTVNSTNRCKGNNCIYIAIIAKCLNIKHLRLSYRNNRLAILFIVHRFVYFHLFFFVLLLLFLCTFSKLLFIYFVQNQQQLQQQQNHFLLFMWIRQNEFEKHLNSIENFYLYCFDRRKRKEKNDWNVFLVSIIKSNSCI